MVWIGTLTVKVLSARSLKACDKNGKSDPYVKLEVYPPDSIAVPRHDHKDRKDRPLAKRLKTTVKKKTLDPVYHETLGPIELNNSEELEFVVKDWNFIGKDHMCGSARVRLDTLGLCSGISKRVDLDLTEQGGLAVQIEFVDQQVLFGLDVTSVVARERGTVPTIVRRCTERVEQMGVEEPGLYRVPGRQADVRRLKEMFITDGHAQIPEDVKDVNTVASLLKLYLREMPEPLFTNALHSELIEAAKAATADDSAAFVGVLRKLPTAHLDTVCHLFRHLRVVHAAAATNKMTAENLGTCFGPSIVSPTDGEASDAMMVSVGKDAMVVVRLLNLPGVLDAITPVDGEDAAERGKPLRAHRARSSLAYMPIHTEYVRVMGALDVAIDDFAQFREICYELGCRATEADFTAAASGGDAPLQYDLFHDWVNRSRLARFVNRSENKRRGITQAINYFKWFDKDHDGTIDSEEWPELHTDLCKHYNLPRDPSKCLAQLDRNGDGVVELEEYLLWCLEPVSAEDIVCEDPEPHGGDAAQAAAAPPVAPKPKPRPAVAPKPQQ